MKKVFQNTVSLKIAGLMLAVISTSIFTSSIGLAESTTDIFLDPADLLTNQPIIAQPLIEQIATPVNLQEENFAAINFASSSVKPESIPSTKNNISDMDKAKIKEQLKISAFDTIVNTDTSSQRQLQMMIDKLNSVKIQPANNSSQPEETEVKPILESQEAPTLHVLPVIDEKLIADETLATLKELAQTPEKMSNPLQLAKILFKSKEFALAATFYKQALADLDKDKVDHASDRSWILYQLGYCFQQSGDLLNAQKHFEQLINNHSNFPWSEAATSKLALIKIYIKDQPKVLIQDIKNEITQH